MTNTTIIDTTVVQKMKTLHDGKIPAHLKMRDAVRIGEEFDPNSYFSVLTHLSMKPGYTLDYIYDYRKGFSGSPHLYARLISDPPLQSIPEIPISLFVKRRNNDDRNSEPLKWPPVNREGRELNDPLPFLVADGTPDSFFQLALFNRLADQFYLYWHSNFNDTTVITSPADIERIIHQVNEKNRIGAALSDEQIEAARNIPVESCVELAVTTVDVSYCIFSKWGGFKLLKETFHRNPPHTLVDSNVLSEVNYSCGLIL